MISVLSLKWKLILVGILCSLLVVLAGGAGVWSLNLIHTAMEETTVEISKNISFQNRQVKNITLLRDLITAIQNIEDLQSLENLFEDVSRLVEDAELQPAAQNINYTDTILDLFIKQQNLFVSRLEIKNKRKTNNKLLEQITNISLEIMDNVQFQSEFKIIDAFYQVRDNITVLSKSLLDTRNAFKDARRLTGDMLQKIRSASLVHHNCNRIDVIMKEIFSLHDIHHLRYKKREMHVLLYNTRKEIDNLPDSENTLRMSKLLVSFRSIADQVADSQERILKQEGDFIDTVRKIYRGIGIAEAEIMHVAQVMKADAEQSLKNSSNLVNKWQNLEFLLMALAFILAVLIGITFSRSVLRQLNSLNEGINIVGKGDFSYKVDTGTRDEIGDISRAFDHMASNIRLAQADLGRALEKAEKANAAKSEFLANMSHELRTPLNAILGFTQIMERNPDIAASYKEKLSIIGRSGEQLLGMINDVLNIAKIESGQSTLNHEIFELPSLLKDVEEMFTGRSSQKNIQFIMDIDPGIPQYIESDSGKILQILINIVGNAFKFTQQGFVSIKLVCHKLDKDSVLNLEQVDLHFEVKDSGIGIASEKLMTIFEPFVQAGHSKEVTAGTGLGLAISQKFTQMLGGKISVSSKVGVGSSFRFHFPVKVSKEADAGHTQPDQRIIGLAPGQPEYRILVVDDSDVNRLLLKELLEIIGFKVLEAENGKQGVEMFKAEQPDLVWMDMQMPVMDGYEASRIIKKSPGGRDIPVIALTANVLEKHRKQILDAGCDDLVCKPFREEEIFSILHRYLDIDYRYGDSKNSEIIVKSDKEITEYLTDESVLSLPEEIVTELAEAALELNRDRCLDIIDQIKLLDSNVANAFRYLVDNFQFEKIHRLADNKRKE